MSKKALWVVETFDRGEWWPTSSIRFSRAGGKEGLNMCKSYNEDNRQLRVRKYVPAATPARKGKS